MQEEPIIDGIKARREEVLALAAHYGASNVRIFGSFARGEATNDSDIDLLVDMDEDRSLFDYIGLWQDLQDLLNRRVDLATEQSLHSYIRNRVLQEAIPL